jgi:CHAT domain-containing protein/tetratricopeptide (TPR) repeat protein
MRFAKRKLTVTILIWLTSSLACIKFTIRSGPSSVILDYSAYNEAQRTHNYAEGMLKAGNIAEAFRYAEQARVLYRRAGSKEGEAEISLLIGTAYHQLYDCRQAERYLLEALPLFQGTLYRVSRARTLFNLASCMFSTGRHQESLDYSLQAEPLLEEEGLHTMLAATLGRSGVILSDMLKMKDKGVQKSLKAAELYHNRDDSFGRQMEAITYYKLSMTFFDYRDYLNSQKYAARALELWRIEGHRFMEAQTNQLLSRIARNRGQFQEAIQQQQQVIYIFERTKEPAGKAIAETGLGELHAALGDHERALHYYRQALQSWEQASAHAGKAESFLSIPPFNRDIDKHLLLLPTATASKNSFKSQIETLERMAFSYQELGDWSNAINAYQAARDVWEKQGNQRIAMGLSVRICELLRGEKKFRRAVDVCKDAHVFWEKHDEPAFASTALINLALIYHSQGNKRAMQQALFRAEILLEQIKNGGKKSHVLSLLGYVYFELEKYKKAIVFHQQTLEFELKSGDQGAAARALSNIGSCYTAMRDAKNALHYYEQAIRAWEKIRTSTTIDVLRMELSSFGRYSYEQALLLRLWRNELELAFDIGERGRARTFLDVLWSVRSTFETNYQNELVLRDRALAQELAMIDYEIRSMRARPQEPGSENPMEFWLSRRRELQKEMEDLLIRLKATHPRYASLQNIDPLRINEVQNLLDEHTTLLSYFVTKKWLVAFVVSKNAINAVPLPVTHEEVRHLVGRTSKVMQPTARGRARENIISLKEIYNKLVKPLIPYLKTPRVGIVPHGDLHYLPFAALTDGTSYLGDRFTIFYLPAASVLKYISYKRSNIEAALIVSHDQPVGFSGLKFANTEARAIAQLYGVQPVTGMAATEEAFKQRSTKASVIHIAAHGEFNKESPAFSRIVLAPKGKEDGSLTVREIYDLDLSSARLVVLSACQTNLGGNRPGDDVVGLTRAFLHAQASAVVSSLWAVDDESTATLMTAFHKELQKGKSKAEALQAAQALTREKFPHPSQWAAFVLTGSPD